MKVTAENTREVARLVLGKEWTIDKEIVVKGLLFTLRNTHGDKDTENVLASIMSHSRHYGIECVRKDKDKMFYQLEDVWYLDAGDLYVGTLVFTEGEALWTDVASVLEKRGIGGS